MARSFEGVFALGQVYSLGWRVTEPHNFALVGLRPSKCGVVAGGRAELERLDMIPAEQSHLLVPGGQDCGWKKYLLE